MSIPSGAPESSCGILSFHRTKQFLLAGLIVSLLFALGCGTNGTSVPGPYRQSSLKGTYVLRMAGNDSIVNNGVLSSESYTETLVITFDGVQNLSGVEDFNSDKFGFAPGSAVTGNYQISNDGFGILQINFASGGQINLTIVMASTSKFYATEADAFVNFSANASGVGIKQDVTAIASAPTGTFVTRVHQVFPTTVSSASVGALTSTNGTTVTGTLDVLRDDVFHPQLTLSAGLFSAPDANGRGTLVYTDSASTVPTNYQYYIIDANTFWLMQSDPTILGTGSAEKQATGTLTFAGNYAFGSGGDTDTTIGAVRSVGVFTADGNGGITAGTLDSVQDGISILAEPFAGTYTQTPNGRVAASLFPTVGPAVAIPEVFWMVSNSRAYFLVADTTKVEDGTLDMQTQGTFSATDFKSQYGYAMVMDGYIPTNYLTRVGALYPDGNGNLALNEETNSLAFPPNNLPGTVFDPPTLQGTYQVRNDGRVSAAISSLSSNLVLYMVAPGQAYILQNDPQVENSGQITLQTFP